MAGVGIASNLAGSIIDMINAPSKPTVPALEKLNLGTEAGKAISANQANLPAAEKLAGQANLFSQQQITDMLNRSIPGYSAMTGTASKNIASELKGEIPQDVQDAIQNSSAAKALGGGFGGSGMHGNLVARDLGLTSLSLTQQGLNSFQSWQKTAASMYEPSMMNVQSMFISPEQMYQADNQQNLQQAGQQWLTNQIDAMPDPQLSAISSGLKSFGSSMMAGSGDSTSPYQTALKSLGNLFGSKSNNGRSADYGGELDI